MKHLGDITLIHGNEIKPVDCIIGGSPCQDLSVAGKRAGLSGERSGLFMEQIRIVKEMRKRYGKPRYMVWENVPGAFSSNNGEDFRAVLEEVTKIADETDVIPRPPKGKWSYAGCIMGDGWSVAWRTHDAQFWGVPQRRRRIALVADFGGESAPEILFERESVSRDYSTCRTPWEGTTGEAENCADTAVDRVKCLTPWDCQSKRVFDPSGSMSTYQAMGDSGANNVAVCYSFDALASNSMKSSNPHSGCRQVDKAKTLDCFDPNPSKNQGGIAIVECYDARDNGDGKTTPTLTGDHQNRVTDYITLTFQNTGRGWWNESPVGATIRTPSGGDSTLANIVCAVDCRNDTENSNVNGTLQAKSTDGQSLNLNNVVRCCDTVRRLTPLECERLQGYPDGWTDIGDWTDSKGKLHKAADAPRYKALGNSIALPFWDWMLRRMSKYLPTGATMGSLFDGIGGFPLLWERIHGAGTARWASEIEEFAIAVTKIRFPEEDE